MVFAILSLKNIIQDHVNPAENINERFFFMVKVSVQEDASSTLGTITVDSVGASQRKQYSASAIKFLEELTPRRLLLRMVFSVFIIECLNMIILTALTPLPVVVEAVIDSTSLIILLSPTFYFLYYRPLFQNHTERLKVIDRLSLSEERLALTLEAVNDGLCDWNIQSGEIYFSPRAQTMLDYLPGDFGNDIGFWQNLIHPDDQASFNQTLEEHLAGKTSHYESEHRLRKKSGEYIWILARGKVVTRDKDGKALRMVGTTKDITKRKIVEAELRKNEAEIHTLSQRLMSITEDEKKHLAQELHDEFGQVLTAFQLGVEMLRSHSYKDEEDFQFHCSRLLKMIEMLEVDLRHICDHLRPMMLEDVGLIETLRWHIKEFVQLDDNLQASFQVQGDELSCSHNVEIVCYRIVQEALNNVVKHSEAQQVSVTLTVSAKQITLVVEDDGQGFAEDQIRTGKRRSSGFGLLGMRERATAVGGKVKIDSNIGVGTRIELVVPRD